MVLNQEKLEEVSEDSPKRSRLFFPDSPFPRKGDCRTASPEACLAGGPYVFITVFRVDCPVSDQADVNRIWADFCQRLKSHSRKARSRRRNRLDIVSPGAILTAQREKRFKIQRTNPAALIRDDSISENAENRNAKNKSGCLCGDPGIMPFSFRSDKKRHSPKYRPGSPANVSGLGVPGAGRRHCEG